MLRITIRMILSRHLLTILGGLLYLLIIVFRPLSADASELIYTIQVGSFKEIDRAIRQYHSVIERLKKEDLTNLRLEKIAEYYSVRLGNFEDPVNAGDFHRMVKHLLPSSILMKAHMKNNRIIKLYSYASPMNKTNENDSISRSELSEIRDSMISDKNKEIEDRLFYTIQVGSFTALVRAQIEFASVIQKLFDTKPDSVRIEKVGEYNAVRIGKFEEYMLAKSYLSSVKSHFESAFIIHAYIRDKRIIRELRQDHAENKNGTNIHARSSNSTIHVDSFRNVDSIGNDQSGQYSMLPVNDKLILQGTVITKNIRLAIIEDSDLKQSGLYNLNDQVGGFIISDILENTVILNKNNTLVKIVLWEDSKIALPNPEPDLSGEIKGKSNQDKIRWLGVRGERVERVGGHTYRY